MKSLLNNAWSEVIRAYERSLVNSERTLQAILYTYLTPYLPSGAIVICEPVIELVSSGQCIPDMLVVKDNEIIAAVELKFVPHHYPMFEGDLEKLKAYAKAIGESFPLLLDSNTGRFADPQFTFSPECLLVFGVFGKHDAEAVQRESINERMAIFGNRFLHLSHAVGK